MIQLITQCGIGLLVGCVLTLAFLPLLRRSAVHSTKRELAAVSPLITGDIQAEKDQMRAEFVMSIRRLEIGMENLREKAIARLGPADKRATEINHLQAELDNKAARTGRVAQNRRQEDCQTPAVYFRSDAPAAADSRCSAAALQV